MEFIPELIHLESNQLKVSILPSLGGKMTSLYCKEKKFELLAQPARPYKKAAYGDDFSQYDMSGIDECFPNVDGGVDPVTGIHYPDHGEIWSAEFEVLGQDNKTVALAYASPHFHYMYQKTIRLEGDRVTISYHIHNQGDQPLPAIWTFHGLFRHDKHLGYLTPFTNEDVLYVAGPKAGHKGPRPTPGPRTPMIIQEGMEKYYFLDKVPPLTKPPNHVGYWYMAHFAGCLLLYDTKDLPYLGAWTTAGGFEGQYHCALEPSNGFYDAIPIARKNNALPVLQPGQAWAFTMALQPIL